MSDIEKYYYTVYPGAKDDSYSLEYINSLNFYYGFVPDNYIKSQGGIQFPETGDYHPPALNSLWFPIWYTGGMKEKRTTCARNWYEPKSWWSYTYKDGFKDNSLVEMIHTVDDNPWYVVYGLWMYYAKGSGIWINIGKSLRAVNKIKALNKLGMNLQDISKIFETAEFRLNRNPYTNAKNDYEDIKVVDFAKQMYPLSSNPLEDLATHMLSDDKDEDITREYMIDRVNNSADYDKFLAETAKKKGYDSVQFTVQANGNGGWSHEILYVNVDPLEKKDDKKWDGWKMLKDKIYVAEPDNIDNNKLCDIKIQKMLSCN